MSNGLDYNKLAGAVVVLCILVGVMYGKLPAETLVAIVTWFLRSPKDTLPPST